MFAILLSLGGEKRLEMLVGSYQWTGRGSIHLYKQREASQVSTALHNDSPTSIVAVLAVPNSITPQDFLKLIGSCRLDCYHFVVLRDSLVNRYMLLIRFIDVPSAQSFHQQFDARPFSSFEPEVCHVVFITNVFVHDDSGVRPVAIDRLIRICEVESIDGGECGGFGESVDAEGVVEDGLDAVASLSLESLGSKHSDSENITHSSHDKGKASGSLDPSLVLSTEHNLIELPTCPVCLERMDVSVTGLLTTVCNHTFHCSCIMKWADSTCPVCRYSMQDDAEQDPSSVNTCADCGATENLWICLICANIGCGRYVRKHAHAHFQQTNHMYSLELETQRVWDYAGDGYVHRLIQSKTDGLVQLPAPTDSPQRVSQPPRRMGLDTLSESSLITPQDSIVAEKVDSLGLDYANMLHAQLSTQRVWYEKQISKIESTSTDQITRLITENESLTRNLQILEFDNQKQHKENKRLLDNMDALQRKLEKCLSKMDTMERELDDEKSLNKQLRDNQDVLLEKLKLRDSQILQQNGVVNELKEQVRDLMFFLETQSRVESGQIQADVKDSSVVGIAPSQSPSKKGKARKGKK